MNIDHLINAMSPQVYEILKQGVEIGKWPNGVALTSEQREKATQGMMLYQGTHLAQTDHMTVGKDGVINHHSKSQLRNQFNSDEITRQPVK